MRNYYILLLIAFCSMSCKKQEAWLDRKSNKADVVPSKLEDFQAILDNDEVMNDNYSALGVIGADNYYITDAVWQSLFSTQERNAYIWAKDIYEGDAGNDWLTLYEKVEYANIVLEGLSKIPKATNAASWSNAKGSALFFRAYNFYILAQLFAKPYSAETVSDPGIPLRLSSDVNKLSERASMQETYQQIISDLKEAEALLPVEPLYKTRPSKPAAQTLLARLYLNIGEYGLANDFATKALSLTGSLIDYNGLNAAATYPLPTFQMKNPEVIFYSTYTSTSLTTSRLLVPADLYNQYAASDLRRTILFRNNGATGIAFRGYYTGKASDHFAGIATNELYLIRAEARARRGDVAGLDDLNALLMKRWKTGSFVPLVASNADEALTLILAERRKELLFTGCLRWEDLRRLNRESRFEKTLSRTVNGTTYSLPPNDRRYVYPIPDQEVRMSGIDQNPR